MAAAATSRLSGSSGVGSLWASDLLLQSGHPLLKVKLQPLVGFGEKPVDSVGQAFIMLFIHFLPLPGLKQETEIQQLLAKVGPLF